MYRNNKKGIADVFVALLKVVGEIGSSITGAASKIVGGVIGFAKSFVSIGGLVGGGAAFFSTPSFVGWSGVGKAALVGVGTTIGGTVGALSGAIALGIAGAVVGGVLGAMASSRYDKMRRVATVGAYFGIMGAVVGGVGGYCYGLIKGYDISKEMVIKKFEDRKINTSFNDAVSGKKFELDRKNFVVTIKSPKPGLKSLGMN